MKITVIGRKCTPRDSFKDKVERKLSKVEKFFSEEASAKVIASVEKNRQSVEITVNSDGMIFRCEQSGKTLEEALDYCVDVLIRRIRRNKTKVEKKIRTNAFEDLPLSDVELEEEKDFDIVRKKSLSIKPQSVEEAILQMNLLGHEFYWFINSETDEMNIVYLRKDGGYGLLEPGTDEE